MDHCLRTDCPDYKHQMTRDCDFGLCPCKDCDLRISPTKNESNSSQPEGNRREIGEVGQPSEVPPASKATCEGSDGRASGGAPTGGAKFIIDVQALLDERESLIDENAKLRSVIVSFHELANSTIDKLIHGERHEAVSFEGACAHGWERAAIELSEFEKHFLGGEVTL